MTVLPVLTYADCLSQPELASVKEAVRRDMAAAFPDEEGAGFGLFGATEDAQEVSFFLLVVIFFTQRLDSASPSQSVFPVAYGRE